ncbi:MAG: DJ-1/PfpI family protein [Burkholderiales bacterium]|jgi:transcriptional regulator GlxA family with amidase domain|nr:DJ-1/PfpI family protein [Burkholderiales bacterium]
MKVAVLTFEGFNELDSFIALGLLSRLSHLGWSAEITSPSAQVRSMNGVTVTAQRPLEFANDADVVLFGSGIHTRAIAANSALLDRLELDPVRQLIGGQCSGTLLMARLGLLADMPACTDSTTKPWVVEAGVRVLEEPFHARGPIATAGGCLASQYLAAWVMASRAGLDAARGALHYAAPVGEKDAYVDRLLGVVKPFLPPA